MVKQEESIIIGSLSLLVGNRLEELKDETF